MSDRHEPGTLTGIARNPQCWGNWPTLALLTHEHPLASCSSRPQRTAADHLVCGWDGLPRFFRCFLRALAPGEKLHQRRFPFQFALAFDRAHQLTDFVVGKGFVGEPDVVFFLEAGLIAFF